MFCQALHEVPSYFISFLLTMAPVSLIWCPLVLVKNKKMDDLFLTIPKAFYIFVDFYHILHLCLCQAAEFWPGLSFLSSKSFGSLFPLVAFPWTFDFQHSSLGGCYSSHLMGEGEWNQTASLHLQLESHSGITLNVFFLVLPPVL